MGTKHDILTENELDSYSINPIVENALDKYCRSNNKEKHEVRVLDWGCGRGRSVYKLIKVGYDAIGYDIDPMVIENGRAYAEKVGLDKHIIQTIDKISALDSGSIDFIFSEQVFEHVSDLQAVAREMFRILKSGGVSVNCYPGTFTIMEEHLFMPFVHWLPKNWIRIPYILLMVLSGKEPAKRWPELITSNAWKRTIHFYNYLDKHTFYRNIDDVYVAFTNVGFQVSHEIKSTQRRWVPKILRKNGFPQASFVLKLQKSSEESA